MLSCQYNVTTRLIMRHKDIERYLQDVLGLTAIVKPWAGGAALPYFLHDAYEFASIELIGAPYVLMLERDKATSASKVRKHLDAGTGGHRQALGWGLCFAVFSARHL